MRTKFRGFAMLFAVMAACALILTPVAAATPECTNKSPTTTHCQTNGSAQIVTSPPVVNNWGAWPWWGGGIVISLGDWGW